jgi:hypothetical protein
VLEDGVPSPGTADDQATDNQGRVSLRGSTAAADAGGRRATGSPPGKRTGRVEDEGNHRGISASASGFNKTTGLIGKSPITTFPQIAPETPATCPISPPREKLRLPISLMTLFSSDRSSMLAYNEEFKENDDDDGRKLGHFRLQTQFLEIHEAQHRVSRVKCRFFAQKTQKAITSTSSPKGSL